MIITYFCKKGGVGKTTVLAEHADYMAYQGKKVLIISMDDQNSVFDVFGKFSEVFDRGDNYLEHVLAGVCTKEEATITLRENIFAVKTLNTDMLSKKLTLERQFEKVFVGFIKDLEKEYDVVFIDLPPSNSRSSEVIFDICSRIILIVGLDKLGVGGFFNTLQYFTDSGIDLAGIKYVLPNGFIKNKSVPSVAMDELLRISKENLPKAKVLAPIPEKAAIQALQQRGVLVFDKDVSSLSPYHRAQKNMLKEVFAELYDKIK